DSKGNIVRQWNRVFSNRGIISREFQLSNYTQLGDWKIIIQVLGQKYHKSFTVAEYILPTFDVEVVLPAFVTYKNSDVLVKVKSMYTYGKPVKGDVTLTVQPRVRYSSVNVRPLEQYQYKTTIDGTVDIALNVVRDLNMKTDLFEREIEFFVLVKETLTGKTYNKTSILRIFNNEVKVEALKSSKTFKPGLKYALLLKVAYQDDTPVEDNGSPLTLHYGYSYNEENQTNVVQVVPQKGIAKINIYPVKNADAFVLGMHVKYRGEIYYLESVEAAQSPSNNFLQIIVMDKEVTVNSEVTLSVNATEPIQTLIYEVMGRGDIVLARSVLVRNSNYHEIKFTVTHAMAPKARVIAYYVRPENMEIVADAVNFDVDGLFRTPITLDTNLKQTKPGSEISLTATTKPNAFVAFLGVDQSILLLKSGNDVTQKDVVEELETYDTGKENKHPLWFGRRKRSFWWPGSTSAAEIFDDSGVVILSNGLVFQNLPTHYSYADVTPKSIILDEVLLDHRLDPPDFQLSHSRESRIVLHQNFAETWLWKNVTAGRDGNVLVSSLVPDTITSWIVSAFAMDAVTGLGIASSPAKVTVFRPFFVKINVPPSVIKGETVAVQVLVFNYFTKPVQAEVVLENSGEFKFTVPSNEVESVSNDRFQKKYVTVAAEDAGSVTFFINTQKIGYITLTAKATTRNAGDGEKRMLLVKAEGQPQYFNKAVLLDLQNSNVRKLNANISIAIPSNAVNGSQRVTISAIGDILGPSLNNIDDLLRMPYGCGEQNMVNFVPNIIVLNYLSRTNKLTNSMKAKAIKNMQVGYQQQLTYRRSDGSFSAFGNSDKNGSVWLTAFVVKSLQQATAYIDIDAKIINDCIQWLMSKHSIDGSFSESGEIHYKAMQGGSSSASSTLTAYVVIALLQNKTLTKNIYDSQLRKSEQFLVRELKKTKSAYVTTILTYALHLLDSPSHDAAFEKMLSISNTHQDYMWWSDSVQASSTDKQSSHFYLPKVTDIEATAYALLTLVARSDISKSIAVMRWLISQQNSNGGFSSTQDTVIGLQALGELASRISTTTMDITAKFTFGESDEKQREMRIANQNAMVLQIYEVPTHKRIPAYVEIEAVGFGTAVVQVSWSYNLAVSAEEPAFFLNPLLGVRSTENFLQLNVCTYYKAGNETNMAVMEVELPSGFVADVDAVQSIRSQAKGVKRIESTKDDTNVVIYFDKITRDELCLTVPAHRNYKVANNKAVAVTLYDYYNKQQLSRLFYQPLVSTVCDICEQEECSQCEQTDKSNKIQDLIQSSSSTINSRLSINANLIFIVLVKFIARY
ncbi:CD109 antigen-like protein, partial [Leptotrombidium deliense]